MTNARAATAEGDRVHFWCPGCDQVHGVDSKWTWNDDLDRPTFTPSVLTTATWGNGKRREDPGYVETERRCHSYVTDGRIQFLGDSTHPLAGQTVDLPAWPYGD